MKIIYAKVDDTMLDELIKYYEVQETNGFSCAFETVLALKKLKRRRRKDFDDTHRP